MAHNLRGVGLPNVFLLNGFTVDGVGGGQTIAFEDLDGLYAAIAHAIATSSSQMTGAELRFMRKRLEQSQEQFGALVGKTGQVVAKWEKAQLPVPLAEATIVRMAWLSLHSIRDLRHVIARLANDSSSRQRVDYVFRIQDGEWLQDDAHDQVQAGGSRRFVATGHA